MPTGCPALTSGPHARAAAHRAEAARLCGEGDYQLASAQLELALAAEPARAAWARDLGAIYAHLERWADVARVLTPVVDELDTDGAVLYVMAAVATGRASEAIAAVGDLPLLTSDSAGPLLCELGRASHAAGEIDRAESFLRRALDVAPSLADAHHMLTVLYHETNRGDLALEHALMAARLRPASVAIQLGLAVAYSSRGRIEESRAARQQALRLGASDANLSTIVTLMLLDPVETAETTLRAARSVFASDCATPRRPHKTRSGRMRVGYLSGEFRAMPNFHFFHAFLAAHDRAACEVFLYNNHAAADAGTTAYRQISEHWRDVAAWSDEQIVAQLERDDLDILIDMSGHFPSNRLSVFAHRSAPIQAAFPGCPSTTGCTAIDHLVTDRWTSPDGSDDEYSEHLHRLPSGYLAYTPPFDDPPPSRALERRVVTFGVFQKNSKLCSEMWDLFAAVLQRTSGSELLLHNGDAALDRPDHATYGYMKAQLAARGIDTRRLRLIGPRPPREHLRIVGSVDIALDTWPYSGQTTSCESLWMGVPVVTRKGGTHAGRVTAGLLERMDLAEWVTTSTDAYVATATALATDNAALTHARATLRGRMIEAGLTDATRLARELEGAYDSWMNNSRPS